MKICIISGTFTNMRCGVGDYTYRLSVELERLGIGLDIITSYNSEVITDGRINICPVVKKWSLLSLPLLLKSIKATKPDLIHLQYPTQAYKYRIMINVFPVFCKLMIPEIPLIVTIHDVKTAHVLNKLRLVTFLFCAKKIIVSAEEEKAYLIKLFPFLKKKFELIYLGSPIEVHSPGEVRRNQIRRDLNMGENEILACHFGYILAKKRIETVFYAVRRLLDDGDKIKLVMISEFDPPHNRYHARLKSLAGRLNLDKQVAWTGYLDKPEVSEYMASSDICVQIYQDGVSLRRTSFIAALEHGLPTVTTKNKDLPGGLKDRYNVMAAPVNNPGALAAAIRELIDSEELRKNLSRNALVFAERFSWKEIASSHARLYNRVKSDEI